MNLEPLPTSLSTQIRPPCISMNFLLIESPRPGAAVFARNGGVGLLELGEEAGDLVRRNADPGVRDPDT
jgi:hypothetical protein